MHGDDNPAADVLDIVWTAVALQPEAEAVIAECLRRGPKGYVLGRRGHAVTSGYFDLREQLRRRRDSPGHRRLEQLLNFHQQIVEQALLLAYRPDSAIRDRVASTFGDLDGPGAALRDLLEDLLTPGSDWTASPD
jgi:hypothetical protein